MKIAVIGLKPYYEADRIVVEGLKNGHEIVYLSKKNIVITNFFSQFGVYFTPPTKDEQMSDPANFEGVQTIKIIPDESLSPKKVTSSLLGKKETVVSGMYDLRYFDVIIFREIAKTLEWATIIANYMLKHDKIVVDEKIGTEMYYKTKLGTFYKASSTGFPYPKSFAVVSLPMMRQMLSHLSYPIIVKVTESSKGKGVFKFSSLQEIEEFFRYEGHKVKECMFQEVIDYRGDIRVFVVGDKVLGAMRREPQTGQWKGNVAQGADAYPVEISEEIKKMAVDVVKLQKSEIIGVDIMMPSKGPVIIEANRAPQFKGFEAATGVNVAGEIISYIENKYARLSKTKNEG
ncbi:MAG: RimK family alpha-L-glutamate ligase [Candidatus Dojkabacteria bacterium]|nr:MAG: RimK family alpha-L-glutamate ligase [Candidatus Dojkabacteria bacterium]